MNRTRKVQVVALGLIAAWLAFGCGGVRQAAQRQQEQNDLKEIGLMYHNYYDVHSRPPEKLDDLQQLGGGSAGFAGLQSGKYVLIYSVDIRKLPQGLANTVLGYEQNVPSNGGAVLMADGSTRHMTATEFQGATKAEPNTKKSSTPPK